MKEQPIFDQEKLDVYQVELVFIAWVAALLTEVRSAALGFHREVCDQLDRASLSSLLNTAEGNGKRQGKQRAKFFDDARGSAVECAACLDALAAKGLASTERNAEGKALLLRIVGMLTKLVERFDDGSYRVHENDGPSTPPRPSFSSSNASDIEDEDEYEDEDEREQEQNYDDTKMKTAILSAVLLIFCTFARAQDALPSWNDTAPKKAIVAFVEKVTKEGSPDFVPVTERIATFDNDGTLWAEQPMYFQVLFVVDRVKALAPQHPEWKTKEPFASLLKGDMKGVAAAGEKGALEMLAATHAGMTTDEFSRIVTEWIATAKHPKTGRPYTEMAYQPMLELLAFLRVNGFKTFIVSGGGIEFIRAFAEKVYGIPPEQVIGSTGKQKFELRDGKPVLVKLPAIDFVDDKEGKPIAIQRVIGRRPIASFGNSDGDLQMLQWTTAGSGARFALLVHHTDAEREWAYDRKSHIGTLDKAWDQAVAKGWTVVNMKDDWNAVFPPVAK